MKIKIPENASLIIKALEARGFRADIVGGCVRDALLGKTANDHDITTSATPDEMKEVFSDFRVVETGIRHGTLTVLVDGEPYEVTTYRVDGEYADNRHPKSVMFTRDIREDLSRRDFTVNAMAYNERDGLTDLFGGAEDLSRGVIRAVGDPMLRFSEDALRILRALRFASVLDFSIDEATADALVKMKDNLSDISAERIFSEWKKLLAGKGAYRIITEFSVVIETFIPELSGFSIADRALFDRADMTLRELSLFASVGGACTELFLSASRRLKTDTRHKTEGLAALLGINEPMNTRSDVHKLAIKHGAEAAARSIELSAMLGRGDARARALLDSVLADGACLGLSDMMINGDDLLHMGYKGPRIGEELTSLLYKIADGRIKNEREALLREATSDLR